MIKKIGHAIFRASQHVAHPRLEYRILKLYVLARMYLLHSGSSPPHMIMQQQLQQFVTVSTYTGQELLFTFVYLCSMMRS